MTSQKIYVAKPIRKREIGPPVDIIIPFHGQYDHVVRLIESIFRFTHSNAYQITLVDDASPNTEFTRYLSEVPNIRCVRCDEQKGFGGALKAGWQESKYPYCLFMHSDCLIETTNWLKILTDSLIRLKPQGVRLVTPTTNNPLNGDHRQQGTKTMMGDDIVLEEGYLSLYCFLCHHDLFDHIGGFIKEYPFAYYEDEELACRMRAYGYKQGIAGRSWVHHIGEATVKEICRKKPDVVRIISEENRLRCIADISSLPKQ